MDFIFDVNLYLKDKTSSYNLSLNTTIEISKEAAALKGGPYGAVDDSLLPIAKELNKGITTVGDKLGLGASIAGLGSAVGKAIASSSLPPIQKTVLVVGGGILGGAIHYGYNSAKSSRKNSYLNLPQGENFDKDKSNLNDFPENIDKFIGSTENSPIVDLIYSIEIISHVCFSIIIILFILILFKFFFYDKTIKLNLSSIIGHKLNNLLNYKFLKYIKLSKMTNDIYILLGFIILIIGLYFLTFFTSELYHNLNDYINIYINKI